MFQYCTALVAGFAFCYERELTHASTNGNVG